MSITMPKIWNKESRRKFVYQACKIVNAKAMRFGKNVSIMPYTMLLCHEGGHL